MVNFSKLKPISRAMASSPTYTLTYVEDIFGIVMGNMFDADFRAAVLEDRWFNNFITSVYSWISDGRPLTTQQAKVALKVIGKVKPILVARDWATEDEVNRMIANPRYRLPPTISINYPREVRYLGDNLMGFRFKRHDDIVERLKRLTDQQDKPVTYWDWSAKLWVVPVISKTLPKIMNIISDFEFDFNDEVAEYIALATNSEQENSIVALNDDRIEITVCDNDLLAAWVISVLHGEIR